MNFTFLGQDQRVFLGYSGRLFRQGWEVNNKVVSGGGGIGSIQGKGMKSALSVWAFDISRSLIWRCTKGAQPRSLNLNTIVCFFFFLNGPPNFSVRFPNLSFQFPFSSQY